jgi:hypothetical protein
VTATDSAGNTYAAAKATGKTGFVVQTSKTGPQGAKPVWSQAFNFGGLSVPAAIAVDGTGNAYVVVNDLDVAATVIIKYDFNGVFVSSQALPFQGPSFSPLASALVLDLGSSRLYTAETFVDSNHGGLNSALAAAYDLNLHPLKVQIVNDGPGIGDESGALVVDGSGRVFAAVTQYRANGSSVSYAVAQFSPGLGQLLSETVSASAPNLGMLQMSLTQNASLPAHGSQPTQLNDVVRALHSVDPSIGAALRGSVDAAGDAWRMGLNLGFAYSHDPARDLRKSVGLQIDLASATVRNILDALTAADTNYYWVQDGSVIDFLPRHPEANSLDVAAVLSQRLPRFTVQNETMVEAIASLIEQAQAQGVTGLFGPKRPRASREVQGWFSDDEKINVSLTGKTVRECLNAIVAADSPSEWIAFPGNKNVKVTATPKHLHHFYHRDLSPQEAADLKMKYPDPPPTVLVPANHASSASAGK